MGSLADPVYSTHELYSLGRRVLPTESCGDRCVAFRESIKCDFLVVRARPGIGTLFPRPTLALRDLLLAAAPRQPEALTQHGPRATSALPMAASFGAAKGAAPANGAAMVLQWCCMRRLQLQFGLGCGWKTAGLRRLL